MVHIFTRAYNAEKCLSRCIDSILNQTYNNLRYYVLDNGSNDSTKSIVEGYSLRDKRIIPFYFKINRSGLIEEFLDIIYQQSNSDDYFCTIDADDEYAPDFLEKMILFIRKNNLDMAACGNDFIDAETNTKQGARTLKTNLIVEGSKFSELFYDYYQFMRTIWGKVYKLSLLRKCNFESSKKVSYGSDTLFSMEAFRNSNRAGILGESLHKYYLSPKSVSYQFDEKRITSDQLLFDAAQDFLISKCGKISKDNSIFLYKVYFNAISDSISVLINSQISIIDKLSRLRDVFQARHTKELIQMLGNEVQKNNIFNQVAVWLLSQKGVCDDYCLGIAADILVAIGLYPTQIRGWQDGWVFMLQVKIRDRLMKMGVENNIDEQIVAITSKLPLLDRLNVDFVTNYLEIIFLILQHEEEEALKQIEEIILQETEISDEYIEAFLTLGLTLAARLEDADKFIYFKKLQISSLMDLQKFDQAEAILADWDEILPNDMDFKELRVRLAQ